MFFYTKDTVPEGLGFKTFDLTHLLWLLALVAVCVAAAVIYRRLSAEKRNVMRCIFGGYIVFQEMLKNVIAYAVGDFGVGHLPFHLCGISIVLIGFDVVKPTKSVRNFLYYIGIPGAALAMLFPNWTTLPVFNFFHIHSFTIHGWILIYSILLVTNGEVKPTIKTMPKAVILLIALAIPIYFINLACDTNFMFLMEPDTGNPLELFEKYLGSHLWGFPVLLPIVMFIMYLPIFIVSTFKKKRAIQEKTAKEEVTV